ncbi:MAG: haloacid dehalogenase-like hydrolase, partial [Phycisphaerales bacterium]|nr:haloacid dehalogenase-like hydrolase [Phycisphaerales bacterium]
MHTWKCSIAVTMVMITALASAALAQSDPLPSWNDGPSKTAITSFVTKVTKEGSPDYVKPAERIATFDNDGTLWCEQPMYFTVMFAFDRIKALAPQHPEWKDTEPYQSVLAGDMKGFAAAGEKGLFEILAATHAGMTVEDFHAIVKDWIKTARHPKYDRPYNQCVYQPMLELLA